MPDTRSHDRQGTILLAACSGLLGLGFLLALLVEQATPRLDPVTLRAAGRPSDGSFSVLFDVTDALTAVHVDRFGARLRELEQENLRPNDLVSIWELGATEEGSLRQLYVRYFPGRDANPLWGNPDRAAARCDSLFQAPMLAVLRRLSTRPRADRSPILAALRELSEQADFVTPRSRRELILVSDLEENSSAACFYRTRPSFQTFRASSAFRAVRADLRGVTVRVFYLTRPGVTPTTGAHLRDFWRAYLTACGASAVEMRRL